MLFRLRNTETEGNKRSRSVISCYTAELIDNSIVNAKCKILTAVSMNIQVFWDMVQCRPVNSYYLHSIASQKTNLWYDS
jgi:hypothetical protein